MNFSGLFGFFGRSLTRAALQAGSLRYGRLAACATMAAGMLLGRAHATWDIASSNRITWQGNVGIPGGIPNRTTIFTNVSAGATEAQIQAVLNICPSNQVVKLGPGTFTITSGLQVYQFITLRGSGPTNTILNSSADQAVTFHNYRSSDITPTLSSGYTKGSTSVVVSSATDIPVGRYLRFYEGADTNFVNPAGIEGGPGTNCLGQWVKVTSVSGTTLGFEPPLFWTYKSGLAPKVKAPVNASGDQPFCELAGLEDLCVSNTATASSSQANIYGQFVARSWVKNVRSVDGFGKHVEAWSWFQCEIRESVITNSLPGSGLTSSRGYGINFGTPNGGDTVPEMCTGNLVENCVFDHNRTHILFGYGAAGNVVAYNLFTNIVSESATIQKMDVAIHSGHNMMNLFEGNLGSKFDADFFHGSGSHNVFFRNQLKGRENTGYVSSLYSIGASVWHSYYTAVGNVLGYSGLKAQIEALTAPTGVTGYEEVAPTAGHYGNSYFGFVLGYDGEGRGTVTSDGGLSVASITRHSNYNYLTGAVDGAAGDTVPDSLYLSGTPSWYPSGYTYPPVVFASGSISIIPAQRWYLNNNFAWDGGQSLAAAPGVSPLGKRRALGGRRR